MHNPDTTPITKTQHQDHHGTSPRCLYRRLFAPAPAKPTWLPPLPLGEGGTFAPACVFACSRGEGRPRELRREEAACGEAATGASFAALRDASRTREHAFPQRDGGRAPPYPDDVAFQPTRSRCCRTGERVAPPPRALIVASALFSSVASKSTHTWSCNRSVSRCSSDALSAASRRATSLSRFAASTRA